MTLSDHQWEFLTDLGRLIYWAQCYGYKLTGGHLERRPGCINFTARSQHNKRLAVDLNLFIDDQYVSSTWQHRFMGKAWERLSPHNRWGGRFKDGNHYERLEVGRHIHPHRWGWFKGQEPLWEDEMEDRTV